VDVPVELRELRYFVAVAEELHFGRAAQRLHMSQSPLSRAIRDLERELGVALFVRTTRHVELTPAGFALLERARRALAEIDGAIEEARRAARPDRGVLTVGYGPLSRAAATRVVEALASARPDLPIRLDEDTTPELLTRVAAHDLDAAAVVETPAAARRYGVRVDTLRDEPLLAAVPSSHRYAGADAIPIGVFAAERVLLPREPSGSALNAWLRAVVRAAGFELERTLETPSAVRPPATRSLRIVPRRESLGLQRARLRLPGAPGRALRLRRLHGVTGRSDQQDRRSTSSGSQGSDAYTSAMACIRAGSVARL
jgi:DNA-binding transcriptional LysR family regulator